MKYSLFFVRLVGLVLGLSLGVTGCFPEGKGLVTSTSGASGEQPMTDSGGATAIPSAGGAGGDSPMCVPRAAQEGAQCHPVQSAEPLFARAVDGVARERTLFREDLLTTMASYCGGCHKSPANLGGFSFSSGNFSSVIDQKVLSAIQSNVASCPRDGAGQKLDPTCFAFMPPATLGGKKWSEREADPDDRLKPFVKLLQQWIDGGRKDYFTVPADPGAAPLYPVPNGIAQALTNLGTCVPDAGMVGTEPSACDLDQRFRGMARDPQGSTAAARLGLPPTLDATDLTSFDSAELARNGVVGYRPAYPLWTDGSGKLRYVRVPVGESITFNKKTKQFDIPANTRFYKTFMKQVKGVDGVLRYHKIETRVIVSRPRDAEGKDQSLFGTYVWEDDESQAKLLTTPQNNGEPFVDQIKTLTIDEGIAAEVKALVKKSRVRNYTYELDSRHATRRYAIPSLQRCIQCHMGSPSQSFVLGFTPLQVNVRPCSPETIASNGHCDAGQIEPASGDEVTQVERLTSYGVIKNYEPADLVKLEDAQGTKKTPRALRTTEELVAQGYMLGNCSHCHNPNGYPSVEHPELAPLLDFLPSARGGIFGFPFERYSPRVFRKATGDASIAYITPSLRDRFGDIVGGIVDPSWKPKLGSQGGVNGLFIDAPWRSLIYRNVDTPFTYVDDSAIYPHMPLNSPGFDCRAPRIIGEWMVSLPALRKHPELNEDVSAGNVPDSFTDLDPQPYREVKPGDADYENGLVQAAKRLATFRAGQRDKNYCPDTSDIVDLTVERSNQTLLIPSDNEVPGLPNDNVPDRPHWVTIDLTNPPGDWNPRRGDWERIIVNQDYSSVDRDFTQDPPVPLVPQAQASLDAQKKVVQLLQKVTLPTDPNDALHAKVPFGIWQQKPSCQFDKLDCEHGYCGKLGDFTGPNRPRWLDLAKNVNGQPAVTPNSPIYSATPGSVVFNMICVNCHGPAADSGGRQAQTLAEMTGGTARVANFRDGFFGPFGKGGENRHRVFGSDDLAARYLPWMALGGTVVRIPRPILNLVANTPVLGVSRQHIDVNSANMLQTAQALCALVGQINQGQFAPSELTAPAAQSGIHSKLKTQLLAENGDEELWVRLCTFNNPAPVHVIRVNSNTLNYLPSDVYFPERYPAGARIGNVRGQVQLAGAGNNEMPWCVESPPAGDPRQLWLDTQSAAPTPPATVGEPLPLCPADFLIDANRMKLGSVDGTTNLYVPRDFDDWATRGAINAGQAVFIYLDEMISQGKGPELRYDECEQLGN